MEKKIGAVDDYFAHVSVVAFVLKDKLNVGDTIRIHGHTTDFTQTVDSMQIEHEKIETAKKGDSIGIKVKERVRKHDAIYKVLPKKSFIDFIKLLFSKS